MSPQNVFGAFIIPVRFYDKPFWAKTSLKYKNLFFVEYVTEINVDPICLALMSEVFVNRTWLRAYALVMNQDIRI